MNKRVTADKVKQINKILHCIQLGKEEKTLQKSTKSTDKREIQWI